VGALVGAAVAGTTPADVGCVPELDPPAHPVPNAMQTIAAPRTPSVVCRTFPPKIIPSTYMEVSRRRCALRGS
jgi:hypothetical protein